jgi:hypothetical protein
MEKQRFKPLWLGIMLGLLVAMAPNWLNAESHRASAYDAPWIYPGDQPGQSR